MRFISLFAAAVASVMLLTVSAGAVSLEQVQPVMPQIDVYVRDGDTALESLTTDDITATLDGTPLEVSLLEPSEQGIFYVFMLDISRSISESHLAAARQAVMDTYQQMGENDQLALLSFGNEVNVLLEGGESATEVQAALNTIHSTDNNTCFYDAMDTLVKTASSQSDHRMVAVVVSDGVDDTDAGMTREELVDVLQQSGVAVYAMAVDSSPKESIKQFQDFIQISGGDLVTFSPGNATEQLASLQSSIDEIWHLQLQSSSNNADGQEHALNIQFGDLDTLDVNIRPTHWTPDETPPHLVSATRDPIINAITLVFSEAMGNLDDSQCYALKDASGKDIPFTVTVTDASTVVLQCSDLADDADCTLELHDLKDSSMEANAIAPYSTVLTGTQTAPAGQDSEEEPAEKNNLLKFLLPAAGILLAVLLLIVVLVIKRRRNPAAKAEKGPKAPKKGKMKMPSSKKSGVTFVFENEDSTDQ